MLHLIVLHFHSFRDDYSRWAATFLKMETFRLCSSWLSVNAAQLFTLFLISFPSLIVAHKKAKFILDSLHYYIGLYGPIIHRSIDPVNRWIPQCSALHRISYRSIDISDSSRWTKTWSDQIGREGLKEWVLIFRRRKSLSLDQLLLFFNFYIPGRRH